LPTTTSTLSAVVENHRVLIALLIGSAFVIAGGFPEGEQMNCRWYTPQEFNEEGKETTC